VTLPTDSNMRKEYPLFRGCLRYFPAALAGVARTSKLGNDKHNPGEPMHHARGKSTDHGDCIIRHLIDVEDLLARLTRGDKDVTSRAVLDEVNQMTWRALALSQQLHENFGSPLAPGAINPTGEEVNEHQTRDCKHHGIPSSPKTVRPNTLKVAMRRRRQTTRLRNS
jgi:hypothetical protein